MHDLKKQVLDPAKTPFERLVRLMEILRSPEGCNWDRKQTHQSLLPYLIEETYEVIEAIESGNPDDLKEELGDLICQVVFHAQLAKEAGTFTVDDSIMSIVNKLLLRHPHVFEKRSNLDAQQVRDQWEKIKSRTDNKKPLLSGLPKSMPALTQAFRIGEKAGGVGFDWKESADVLEKIHEELKEVSEELSKPTLEKERLADEIGDLLFAVASLARKVGVDPESALKGSLSKFQYRFKQLEEVVKAEHKSFDGLTLDQLEAIWQQIKSKK
ncbi:MAG: nucleoside triphosphate pyrophosphohydrolase [candidate division Zixibacteria bacterium]|nr:nucleoside triphosphate pyrophosphohydrolase [candidate division Zixibacteria bacterium]